MADKLLAVPEKKGSRPTSTCLKLAESCENGAVFHHAGLFSEQKEIIEELHCEFYRYNEKIGKLYKI